MKFVVLLPLVIIHLFFIKQIIGGCTFRKSWQGYWFQSGFEQLIRINDTHIETKGECLEEQEDKYLIYDKNDNCYRCMAIHEKHASVLQYKESLSDAKASLQEVCYGITGDAPLYSMFRKQPEPKPVACPFKGAPFTFSYNRGAGDCSNPPSKAESCTDDSRLVLKYQACPDVPGTESNIEKLVCLATWKEGSTRYLIGRISQGNRNGPTPDEDQYRCFVYQRSSERGKTIYNIAQSGDATCNGLANAFEGSRTMKLTTMDDHHKRCKFPVWITDHHTWLSLDHHKTYKFSQRNATLKILDDESSSKFNKPPTTQQHHTGSYIAPQPVFGFQEFGFKSQDQRRNMEMRLVCHAILESQEQKKVQVVAHITAGCESGYVCMVFYKRDSNVIEIQQTDKYVDNPDEACTDFDPRIIPYTTLITTNLHPKKCPHLGRYTVTHPENSSKRKRRQQPDINLSNSPPECLSHDYEALSVGCSGNHEMEFRSTCAQNSIHAYSCHGSWEEDGVSYVISTPVARKSTDALKYCFIYTLANQPQSAVIEGGLGKNVGPPVLRLSASAESCHRHIKPGISGSWAFNFTSNGTCAESDDSNAGRILIPTVCLMIALLTFVVLR